jgi:hypothetical protein
MNRTFPYLPTINGAAWFRRNIVVALSRFLPGPASSKVRMTTAAPELRHGAAAAAVK